MALQMLWEKTCFSSHILPGLLNSRHLPRLAFSDLTITKYHSTVNADLYTSFQCPQVSANHDFEICSEMSQWLEQEKQFPLCQTTDARNGKNEVTANTQCEPLTDQHVTASSRFMQFYKVHLPQHTVCAIFPINDSTGEACTKSLVTPEAQNCRKSPSKAFKQFHVILLSSITKSDQWCYWLCTQ